MSTISNSIMLSCILVALSSTLSAQSPSDDAFSARADEVVRAEMREHKIPGVSLAVMRQGKIIKATGYGLANVELSVPVKPEMVFHIGSVAKAFAATAVMMLVEEGKVASMTKSLSICPRRLR